MFFWWQPSVHVNVAFYKVDSHEMEKRLIKNYPEKPIMSVSLWRCYVQMCVCVSLHMLPVRDNIAFRFKVFDAVKRGSTMKGINPVVSAKRSDWAEHVFLAQPLSATQTCSCDLFLRLQMITEVYDTSIQTCCAFPYFISLAWCQDKHPHRQTDDSMKRSQLHDRL